MNHEDVSAITQLINLYGFAVDSQRWELFDQIFTEDVEAHFSDPAHWLDRESFKRDFAAFHQPFDNTQHCMMNHVIRVHGDSAQALTYGTWRLVRKATDGNPLWDGSGWYDDTLVRTPGGWRICRRICRVVWFTGNPMVNETIPGVKFDLQTRSLRKDAAAGDVDFFNSPDPD